MGASLSVDVLRTPWPRRKEGTHPGRISRQWNVATPMRSGWRGIVRPGTQYANRKGSGIPQWAQEAQEAKASSRKARGSHNPLDRALPNPKGC